MNAAGNIISNIIQICNSCKAIPLANNASFYVSFTCHYPHKSICLPRTVCCRSVAATEQCFVVKKIPPFPLPLNAYSCIDRNHNCSKTSSMSIKSRAFENQMQLFSFQTTKHRCNRRTAVQIDRLTGYNKKAIKQCMLPRYITCRHYVLHSSLNDISRHPAEEKDAEMNRYAHFFLRLIRLFSFTYAHHKQYKKSILYFQHYIFPAVVSHCTL